jgi:hypothetical protein
MDEYIKKFTLKVSIAVVGSWGFAQVNKYSQYPDARHMATEIINSGTDMDCKLIGHTDAEHHFLFESLCKDIDSALFFGNVQSLDLLGFADHISGNSWKAF